MTALDSSFIVAVSGQACRSDGWETGDWIPPQSANQWTYDSKAL